MRKRKVKTSKTSTEVKENKSEDLNFLFFSFLREQYTAPIGKSMYVVTLVYFIFMFFLLRLQSCKKLSISYLQAFLAE